MKDFGNRISAQRWSITHEFSNIFAVENLTKFTHHEPPRTWIWPWCKAWPGSTLEWSPNVRSTRLVESQRLSQNVIVRILANSWVKLVSWDFILVCLGECPDLEHCGWHGSCHPGQPKEWQEKIDQSQNKQVPMPSVMSRQSGSFFLKLFWYKLNPSISQNFLSFLVIRAVGTQTH